MPKRRAETASPNAIASNALVWAAGLLCGALVTLLPATALLLGVLLGPAIIALALDRQPGKPIGRSVALCTLAACVAPVRALWAAGHDMAASLALTADANTVGTAWSAAAAGWLLAQLAPLAVRAVLEAASLSRAARLRATRAALAEEWGLGEAPLSDAPPLVNGPRR
jgi:hypothetical protein